MAEPNYRETVPFDVLEYTARVAKALKEIPRSDASVEIDDIPVKWHDEVVGYLVLSEIDGQTYEYAPVLRG